MGNGSSEWLFCSTVDLNHCLFHVKALKRIPSAKHWLIQLKEYKNTVNHKNNFDGVVLSDLIEQYKQ